jgi:uncharacterized protein YjbI with pentapeptide repeats
MPTPFQQRATERRAKIVAEVEAAKKTLEDATTVGAGFRVSYIFLMFYIAVSAGAVTHVGLLVEDPVKLPFLNLDLPLLGFFFLAPILFIIMHVFTLSKLVMLAEKSKRFLEALEKLPTPAARENLRRALPSNIFTQFMAGPTELSGGPFGVLLLLMGWITMALGPILLLLFLQIQFLPYHSYWHTWEHRAALLVDLLLLWWLWRRALQTSTQATTSEPAAPAGRWERAKDLLSRGARFVALLLGLVLSAGVLFASLVATYPTEWETSPLAFAPHFEAQRAALTEAIFAEKSSCTHAFNTSLREILSAKALGKNTPFPRWPCNTLYLEEFNTFEKFNLKNHNELDGRDFTLRLRERRLEGANLSFAKLGKTDLRDAKLTNALLERAELQGAVLADAHLEGAKLNGAQLQGASLNGADLRAAWLMGTGLQGASLNGADLGGASLESARLQGASLQGGRLKSTIAEKYQGVRFVGGLRATSLANALVWRADFKDANITSTSLSPGTPNWRAITLDDNGEHPWTQEDYDKLKSDLTAVLPEGEVREKALKLIKKLDCKKANDKKDCHDNPTIEENATNKLIKEAIKRTNPEFYAATLADELNALVCSGEENAIYVLRALIIPFTPMQPSRFADTAGNAPQLVDDILSPKAKIDCPVSADLNEDDKIRLLVIKKWAEEKYPP